MGPVYEEPERNEPQAAKGLDGEVKLVMQVERQHGEGVTLGLVENGEEVSAASEKQGRYVICCVDEENRRGHKRAEDHQDCERTVDSFKQPIKRQRDKDPYSAADQVADNAEAEEQLVASDVIGRCCSVSLHD